MKSHSGKVENVQGLGFGLTLFPGQRHEQERKTGTRKGLFLTKEESQEQECLKEEGYQSFVHYFLQT